MQEQESNYNKKKSSEKKYLKFSLEKEHYGVPLSFVKEVIGMMEITEVPSVPPFFKGLINLRGQIISIIDLKTKLKIKSNNSSNSKKSIIISEINEMLIGSIVDNVEEVISIKSSDIETNIDINDDKRSYILGVAKGCSKKLTIILDINKTINREELELIKSKAIQ